MKSLVTNKYRVKQHDNDLTKRRPGLFWLSRFLGQNDLNKIKTLKHNGSGMAGKPSSLQDGAYWRFYFCLTSSAERMVGDSGPGVINLGFGALGPQRCRIIGFPAATY